MKKEERPQVIRDSLLGFFIGLHCTCGERMNEVYSEPYNDNSAIYHEFKCPECGQTAGHFEVADWTRR